MRANSSPSLNAAAKWKNTVGIVLRDAGGWTMFEGTIAN
jgi:hypothetical protein